MSEWRQHRRSTQDRASIAASVCRFGVEQVRDVYLALRQRPGVLTLPRPRLGERLALVAADTLPSFEFKQVSARVSALLSRWKR
jgi:hypothetical protein